MMHAPIYIVHNESMGLTDYGLTGTVSIVSVVTIFQYHLCNKIHFVPVYITIYWEYCPQTGSLYVHFSLTLNTRKLTKEFINWVVGTSVPASLVPAVATSVGDWNCQVPADADVRMNGIYTDCLGYCIYKKVSFHRPHATSYQPLHYLPALFPRSMEYLRTPGSTGSIQFQYTKKSTWSI